MAASVKPANSTTLTDATVKSPDRKSNLPEEKLFGATSRITVGGFPLAASRTGICLWICGR
jgi:hypothetical protein